MSSSSIGFNIKNITTQEFFDFHYKESCTLATTGALTLASDFNTGDTLDSVTLVLGDRILIKDQADASENGIYTVNDSGAPTRAVDFDNPSEVTKGAYVSVVHGSTNSNTSYVMSTNAVPTVIDTTELTFTNISSVNLNTLSTGVVNVASDSITFIDSDDNSSKKETIKDLVGSIAGTGLTGNSNGTLSVDTSSDIQIESLGVGTAASGATGTIRATNDITAYYSSDKRLKDNIKKIENPLEKLEKINGYTFDWIPKENIHSNEGKDIGVIAQEIEEVIPEITTTRDNGYKAVKYEKVIPLLIECIKEQQEQINELKNK